MRRGGLFDAPEAAQAAGGCRAPAPQMVRIGAPAAVAVGEDPAAGGCCGS